MQTRQAAAREDATHEFKRFILERSRAFESEPRADLYRVNLLSQMLDRYDALREVGTSEALCRQRVRREFEDIPTRMADAGFERAQTAERGRSARFPALSEAETERYIDEEEARAKRIGTGAGLCAACCAPLMAAMGFSMYISDDMCAGLGLAGMFAMIGLGVYMFATAPKPKLREQLKRERVPLTDRARRAVEDRRERERKRTAGGIALLVSSIVPFFLCMALGEGIGGENFFIGVGLAGFFGMIGAGVRELVYASGVKNAIKRLLRR